MSDSPRGKTPTWDFYGASSDRTRVLGMAQALLDGRTVSGPEEERAAALDLAVRWHGLCVFLRVLQFAR